MNWTENDKEVGLVFLGRGSSRFAIAGVSDVVIRGRIENGVVRLEGDVSLPDGTLVTVVPEQPASEFATDADVMSNEEQERLRAALSRIDAAPNENPGARFSGAEHDRELYGAP